MGLFLLDTTVLVDFSRHREPVYSRLQEMLEGNDEVGVSPINVTEFFSWFPPERTAAWVRWLDSLRYWPISRRAAEQAGAWRYEFARRGVTLSVPDTLITAVAHELGATLVTDNARHFPMPGLSLLSLR